MCGDERELCQLKTENFIPSFGLACHAGQGGLVPGVTRVSACHGTCHGAHTSRTTRAHSPERDLITQPAGVKLGVGHALHVDVPPHHVKKVADMIRAGRRSGGRGPLLAREKQRGGRVECKQVNEDSRQTRGPIGVDAVAAYDEAEGAGTRKLGRVLLPRRSPGEWRCSGQSRAV